jgi:hypothetical protein
LKRHRVVLVDDMPEVGAGELNVVILPAISDVELWNSQKLKEQSVWQQGDYLGHRSTRSNVGRYLPASTRN